MAGQIPQSFIDDLLARVDIVEVIDARVGLKRHGKEYVACCPFHNEKTPSFTVSPQKQFYHCFGCGAHGTALGFLMDFDHLEFVEAVETLAQSVGMNLPQELGTRGETTPVGYDLLAEAARYYRQQLKRGAAAIDYLKGRGLTGQVASEFGLGFAPSGWDTLLKHFQRQFSPEQLREQGLAIRNDQGHFYDRFRNRIMFPIRDRRGRVIGFGGRLLGEGTPKYLNSPETGLFHKGRALYGLYESRQAQDADQESVLVVEGYMDVLALAQHGVRNVVATLGTATTHQHLETLYRQFSQVVFCFDGDRAGREAAWRAVEQLMPVFRDGFDAKFLFLPEGEDPDSLIRHIGVDDFKQRIQSAMPLADVLFKHFQESADIATTAGRARLAKTAIPVLDKLREGVFKSLLYERLAEMVGVRAERLVAGQSHVSKVSSPAPRRQSLNTPIRTAITLLLHEPNLALGVESTGKLGDLSLPGAALFKELVETFQTNPHVTSAGLVERYRNSDVYKHLLKLMEWEPLRGEQFDVRKEFQDAVARLEAAAASQRAENLLQIEREKGLTDLEKAELCRLLTDESERP